MVAKLHPFFHRFSKHKRTILAAWAVVGLVVAVGAVLHLLRAAALEFGVEDLQHSAWQEQGRNTSIAPSPSQSRSRQECYDRPLESGPEARHVAYLKVHKTGSSTLQNIFFRFGLSRDLTFVLPRSLHILGHDAGSIRRSLVLPPPGNRTFDILCNHVVYNATVFEHYLPPDTHYIASIREPFRRLYSAFLYYRKVFPMGYLSRVAGPDPFLTYIKHLQRFEPEDPFTSQTNNRLAVDLGFAELGQDLAALERHLEQLDRRLDLVVVAERFLESLVLLRRKLGWQHKDIVFLKHNKLAHEEMASPPAEYAEKVRDFLKFDHAIYKHYSDVLDRQIQEQGDDFQGEVQHFKAIQEQITDFCSRNPRFQHMEFSTSSWSDSFRWTSTDCHFLSMNEVRFTRVIRHQHLSRLHRCGENHDFVEGLPGDQDSWSKKLGYTFLHWAEMALLE